MKLQGIRLLVQDFDRMYDFYSEKLGLEVAWGKLGEVYASFKFGEHIGLAIFNADLMDEAIGISAKAQRRAADNNVLIIDTSDLEGLYKKLKSKGVEFVTEPHDMPGWGNRCAHLRDPEGNLIELSTNLSEDKWDEDLKEMAEEYKI